MYGNGYYMPVPDYNGGCEEVELDDANRKFVSSHLNYVL